ncbi:MAG: hypothetical protein GY940_13065 [bacterium]|nr:hypothetical protein [bacterium]
MSEENGNRTMGILNRPVIPILLIILFLIIIYLPSLNTYLRGDDFEWLASSYAGWQNPPQLLELINHFFRPLVKLSYLLDYTFFKTHVFYYNATTLLFHLVNIALLYWLMYGMFRRIRPAALIALCYGVSAMYSEVTLWSAGRPDAILLMFMLGVLILLNRNGEKIRHIPVILLTLLAIGSKETWILLPFLALALLWMVKQTPFKAAIKASLSLFLLLGIYLGYFIALPIFTGTTSPASYAGLDIGAAIKKLGYLLFKYAGLGDSFTASLWQYLLILILLAGLTYRLLRTKNRPALYGLFWMLFTMGISLPIQFAPSRYNYLPLIGFWLLVVAFLEPEIKGLVQRFNIKKIIALSMTGLLLLFYISHQAIMLQWEIKDHRRWGETHRMLADMYMLVKDQLPHDRPLLFIDLGKREAVTEIARSTQGYKKLLFVRNPAIWQQVFLSPLDNFLGDPFNETLEPVPQDQLDQLFRGEYTALVFTDAGFYISAGDHKERVRDFYRQNGELPYKVQALRRVKR